MKQQRTKSPAGNRRLAQFKKMRQLVILIFLSSLLSCTSTNSDNDRNSLTDSSSVNGDSVFIIDSTMTQKKDIVTKNNDSLRTLSESQEKEIDEVPNDTVVISNKTFLFFSLSQVEYDEMMTDPNSGINEVMSDLNYYSSSIADSLTKRGYITRMTASRFIKVLLNDKSFKIYDRLSDKNHNIGYIITDGVKEPKVRYGLGTDIDYLISLNDFEKKK